MPGLPPSSPSLPTPGFQVRAIDTAAQGSTWWFRKGLRRRWCSNIRSSGSSAVSVPCFCLLAPPPPPQPARSSRTQVHAMHACRHIRDALAKEGHLRARSKVPTPDAFHRGTLVVLTRWWHPFVHVAQARPEGRPSLRRHSRNLG